MKGASKSLRAYQGSSSDKALILSQSCLNLVKQTVGKYLELMSVVRSCSFDIFVSLTQACELYVFLVFHMFCQSQSFKRLFDDSLYEGVDPAKVEDLSKLSQLHALFLHQQRYRQLRNFMIRARNIAEA